MSKKREIFFHVGLGKVASTFLQKSFFPKLKGIQYIPSSKYKKSKILIPKYPGSKLLVSREFDRQLEREVRWFSNDFPGAKVIILLRRHDDWIASQYRRHVKNGWFGSFEEFIDLENDAGFWEQKDLYFYPMVEVIQEHFNHKPLVLFYEDLKKDPLVFLRRVANYMQVDFKEEDISLKPVHTSFSNRQLLILRAFCRKFIRKTPNYHHDDKLKHWLFFRPVWAFYHLILYLSSLVPKEILSDKDLIKKESLEKVRAFYEDDWQKVKTYAKETQEA